MNSNQKNFHLEIRQVQHKYEAKVLTEVITQSSDVVANCQSISFLNDGDVDAFVFDIPLRAGEPMLSINGEVESVDTTRYRIVFDRQTEGIQPKIVIIRRFVNKIEWQA